MARQPRHAIRRAASVIMNKRTAIPDRSTIEALVIVTSKL